MTTEADIDGQINRLVRNTDNKIKFALKHYDGFLHLHDADTDQGITHGNSKSELYYQLVFANKILELVREKECK